jgi:hypothetical protein
MKLTIPSLSAHTYCHASARNSPQTKKRVYSNSLAIAVMLGTSVFGCGSRQHDAIFRASSADPFYSQIVVGLSSCANSFAVDWALVIDSYASPEIALGDFVVGTTVGQAGHARAFYVTCPRTGSSLNIESGVGGKFRIASYAADHLEGSYSIDLDDRLGGVSGAFAATACFDSVDSYMSCAGNEIEIVAPLPRRSTPN